MLVKLTVFVHLVNDKYFSGCWTVSNKNINLVAVFTLCTTEISIMIVHLNFPRCSVLINTRADTSFRVFNGNVKAIDFNMAHFIIASFFLSFCRLSVYLLALVLQLVIDVAINRTFKYCFVFDRLCLDRICQFCCLLNLNRCSNFLRIGKNFPVFCSNFLRSC